MLRRFFQELNDNKASYFVSFLTIFVSLTILIFFAFIYLNLYMFSQKTSQNLAITIYLEPNISKEQVALLKDKIKVLPGVENIKWIPPQEITKKLQKIFKETPEVFSEIDWEKLPSFLEVTFKDPLKDFERNRPYFAKLEKEEGVLKVRYAEGWLARINSFANFVKFLTIFGMIMLTSSLIFLMTVTITLTLEKQKEEIEILSLLGATPGYIARPKILVSFFIGILASLFSLTILTILRNYLEKTLLNLLPFYKTHLLFFSAKYLILGIGGMGLFCAIVSWFSVRRYFS